MIGGSPINSVADGVHTATIAGGGLRNPTDPATANQVTANQGTVGGGTENTASGIWSTVAGGQTATRERPGNDRERR